MKVSILLAGIWGIGIAAGAARAETQAWDALFQRLRSVDQQSCGLTLGSPGDLTEAAKKPAASRVQRAPAVVSVESEPLSSEVKLKLECPKTECQMMRRWELIKLFKEKVNAKKIWLYDFADKRLKNQVTIRKRTEKGQTLLTVKLKNVVPAGTSPEDSARMIQDVQQKYLAGQTVKGNKCEQDWNEIDGDRSAISCSFTVALTAEQDALAKPGAKDLLTPAQLEFVREYKNIDLAGVNEPFAEPAHFEAEEQKLLADGEVSIETWWKPKRDSLDSCYAFEISTKVPSGQAADASRRLNDVIRPFIDSKSECPLLKSVDQNRTKSM